jgi:hypothetical protein
LREKLKKDYLNDVHNKKIYVFFKCNPIYREGSGASRF